MARRANTMQHKHKRDSNAVRKARAALAYTQEQFADALGKSTRTIARYENGGPVPVTTIMAIKLLQNHRRR